MLDRELPRQLKQYVNINKKVASRKLSALLQKKEILDSGGRIYFIFIIRSD